jgi:hypothetical protein
VSRASGTLRERGPRAVGALDLPAACDLPQLAAIVEPGRLRRALGDALAHAEPSAPALLDCNVTKLHYRPGKGCRLVITARFRGSRGRSEEQLYFGRLVPGASAGRHAAPDAGAARPRFGPPSLHLPEWELKLWAYPNDPELPGLPLLADPERVRARIAAAPQVFGLEAPPRALRATRAKYVPGKRCGYLYEVRIGGEPPRAPVHRIYAKCHAGDAARAAHDAMSRVWDSPAVRAGRVRVPRPFALDAAEAIAWQEGLAGQPLLKQRAPSARLPGLAAEIGERLAAFHGSGATLPIEMDHAFQIAMLRSSLESARATLPAAARPVCELGEHLLALGARFEPLPAVTLHGSFRLSHVMETTDGIAFIDLEGANAGDPAVDLGRFLSHLKRLEAQGSLPLEIADATAREFRRGYQAAAPVTVSDERIGWSTAVHLVSGGLDKALRRMDSGLLDALARAAARSCPA